MTPEQSRAIETFVESRLETPTYTLVDVVRLARDSHLSTQEVQEELARYGLERLPTRPVKWPSRPADRILD